jgi:hypothetical protein
VLDQKVIAIFGFSIINQLIMYKYISLKLFELQSDPQPVEYNMSQLSQPVTSTTNTTTTFSNPVYELESAEAVEMEDPGPDTPSTSRFSSIRSTATPMSMLSSASTSPIKSEPGSSIGGGSTTDLRRPEPSANVISPQSDILPPPPKPHIPPRRERVPGEGIKKGVVEMKSQDKNQLIFDQVSDV